ncbi:MAG: 2-oxo acid dehydrogenase subunit E2, partial [Sulfolobales archaeon]
MLREIERIEKYTSTGVRVKESIPMSPVREVIAKRMVESLQTMAQVTLTTEAIVDALVEVREELLKELGEGIRVTYTDILVKTVAMLLREHPYINATLEEDKIKILE